MANPTYITIGHASSASYGTSSAGDQGQKSTPDYNGEVPLRKRTIAEFNSYYGDGAWKVIRPRNPSTAAKIAHLMTVACNNKNIGYGYGAKGMKCQGGSNKVDTKTKCNTDCSGLVSECIYEATGKAFNCYTGNLISTAESLKSGNQNVFYKHFVFKSFKSTPVYNGDVMVTHTSSHQHTCIVVAGNPRDGQADENPKTGSNNSTVSDEEADYGCVGDSVYMEVEMKYSVTPRSTKPTSSDKTYKYFTKATSGNYGKNPNGNYAWGRFSEICDMECSLSKGAVKTWFAHGEDKYARGVAPSLGAVMCFTNIEDASSNGFACVIEVVGVDYVYVSYCKPGDGSFVYSRMSKVDGSWNFDYNKDGSREFAFQGCIYPPNIIQGTSDTSALDRFITLAIEHEAGNALTYTKNSTGINTNTGWSAAYVVAIAKEAGGIIGTIIPESVSVTGLSTSGVTQGMGVWYDGPALGGSVLPQVGDIAFFRTQQAKNYTASKYQADNCGVVISVNADAKISSKGAGNNSRAYSFTVVRGDSSGRAVEKQFYNNSSSLSGIYRPNWETVDGEADLVKYVSSPIGMYNEGTTIEDAAIRDIAYAAASGSGGYKPSITETGITLAAINYTGMLSNMYSVLAEVRASADDETVLPTIWSATELTEFMVDIYATEPFPAYNQSMPGDGTSASSDDSNDGGGSGDSVSYSASGVIKGKNGNKVSTTRGTMVLDGNARAIFETLYGKLNNRVAVCAIMASMWQESGWNIGALNKSDGGAGLAQWTDVYVKSTGRWSRRGTAMKNWCKTHGNKKAWNHNLQGQLTWLFHEASGSYKSCWNSIKKAKDTKSSLDSATVVWFRGFESGGQAMADEEVRRKRFAHNTWKLFIGT